VQPEPIRDVDPFDLPEWLGTGEVTWEPDAGLRTGHHVRGHLRATGEDPLVCDLLAVDEAYPAPVTDDRTRSRSHQSWRHDQVLLGTLGERLTLAVPGTRFDADRVIDALARLAKAVGATPDRWAALLRIGTEQPRRSGR
jgi:hypothetical protein